MTLTARGRVSSSRYEDDEFDDFELDAVALAAIAGGFKQLSQLRLETTHDEPWGRCPGMRPRKMVIALILSHLRAEPMSNEKLDAVRDLLMSDDNAEILEKISSVWLEDPDKAPKLLFRFRYKGLKLDATADEVVDHLEKLDDDLDIELTPEMGVNVAKGAAQVCRSEDQ